MIVSMLCTTVGRKVGKVNRRPKLRIRHTESVRNKLGSWFPRTRHNAFQRFRQISKQSFDQGSLPCVNVDVRFGIAGHIVQNATIPTSTMLPELRFLNLLASFGLPEFDPHAALSTRSISKHSYWSLHTYRGKQGQVRLGPEFLHAFTAR